MDNEKILKSTREGGKKHADAEDQMGLRVLISNLPARR